MAQLSIDKHIGDNFEKRHCADKFRISKYITQPTLDGAL